ncbi:MAG: response regulator transcription factor [Myxococcales bacterium]|nr:response regulator transcription factor [Myxococcales bacterium]
MATKILAIDDSKTMRLAIKITFAAEDAEVTSVSKGSDAVARIKAKQGGYDVVLVDASLAAGEPSGYEVCRAIKQDPATAKIPVVLLVSNQSGVDEAQLASAGGDDWLAKPFSTDDLIAKVSGVIAKGSRPAAAAAATPPAAAARPPRPTTGPQPAVAAPPAAARAARPTNRTQMGMPAPATQPASAATTKTVATPNRQPAARVAPPPARTAPATPAPAPARPAPAPTPAVAARPAPASAPTPVARPAVARSADGAIPIAIPIPFTAADSPTPGMVERLQQAAGAAGVDPKVAQALAALSREVVERIVWEVVPELAESIIREQQARA